jgi:D-alanyl-lipoteichoic acid acyltransferase DltB (MBOAT superfamily)
VPFDIAWLGALAYALQLYFDFSGYSDMAIGLSRMLGVQLPVNFNSPYKAISAIDFWRRWHMTLSRFLRDYLYIPLGGNRLGPRRRIVNLMIVMLLGGLWHGAGWTFVIWGGLHGAYLVINHLWRGTVGEGRLPPIAARLLTFLAVLFAWVVFRAADLPAALRLWTAMLGATPLSSSSGTAWIGNWAICLTLLGVAWFAPNTQQIMRHYRPGLGAETATPTKISWHPRLATALVVTALLAHALYLVVFTDRVSDFLYFQF